MNSALAVRLTLLIACMLIAPRAVAQPSQPAPPGESKLHAELRREGERIKESCGDFSVKTIAGCAVTLATDHPLHIAFGSIAPQNGFGFGLAFVTGYTPSENWRLTWNADAVGAPSGAWRTGAYMKIIRTAVEAPRIVVNPAGASRTPAVVLRPYLVLNIYAQAISLPTISFFGLGPDASRDARTFFRMRQTIVGTNVIWPAGRGLNLSLLGEVNGRFVTVRGASSGDAPSIDRLFTERDAPGLGEQPAFVQFGEGVRIKPSLFDGHVRLNYLAELQQFVASESTSSFRRWTIDLTHEIPLYRTSLPGARDTNGPNECAIDPTSDKCPSVSRNRTGSVGLRLFVSKSQVSGGHVVPFYFQRTAGGSDVNGNRVLPSYDDYRFRGPHAIVLQETFEHSIYGPLGLWLAADQGKVALQGSKIDFNDLRHSYAVGATLRAGGFPAVVVSWATGGTEGHHVAFTISTSLLGGSARPSLQ